MKDHSLRGLYGASHFAETASGNRSSQYHIEEKGRESGVSGVDHAQGTEEGEQEEEMGIGRLLKLIAAFENN